MELLHAVDGDLLEGPVWDVADGSVLFVDMRRPALHRLGWDDGSLTTFGRGTEVSAVLPAVRSGLVVAERSVVTLGVGEPMVPAGDLVLDDPGVRFNDAACDAVGRLFIGTMADDARPRAGRLHRLEPDLSWTTVLNDLTISNGLGWSPDDRRMYFVDSATRRVDVFDYDLATGTMTDRRPFVDTRSAAGIPDGLAVDADGCVWVAFYRGQAVRRYAPDGRLLEVLTTPVPRPTSVCFAGPNLDVLVITTRRAEVGPEGRPCGAHLYAHQTTTSGVPTAAFGG